MNRRLRRFGIDVVVPVALLALAGVLTGAAAFRIHATYSNDLRHLVGVGAGHPVRLSLAKGHHVLSEDVEDDAFPLPPSSLHVEGSRGPVAVSAYHDTLLDAMPTLETTVYTPVANFSVPQTGSYTVAVDAERAQVGVGRPMVSIAEHDTVAIMCTIGAVSAPLLAAGLITRRLRPRSRATAGQRPAVLP